MNISISALYHPGNGITIVVEDLDADPPAQLAHMSLIDICIAAADEAQNEGIIHAYDAISHCLREHASAIQQTQIESR